uniref:Uncharacterized protein MANES_03G010000 n=1 Tax=Rhizophora mucronata TaxID=61149 RepID=A0A2P2KMC2_RHIMU
MASMDSELEQQLLEAGNRLENPPASVDELFPLLDKTAVLADIYDTVHHPLRKLQL